MKNTKTKKQPQYNKRKKGNKTTTKIAYINMIPIIIALAIVPLIVRLKVLDVPDVNVVWPTNEMVQLIDVYTYYKGMWLLIAAGLAMAIYAYNVYKKNDTLPTQKSYTLLYGYVGLVIISFIFSINHNVSFLGYSEHFENVFILLAYIVLFIYTSMIVKNEKEIKFLINFWIGAIIIMFLIGLSQYFDNDFFLTPLGRSLVLPFEYANATLSGDTDLVRNVSQTLFHYNYVSFYAAIGLPFFFVLAVLEKEMKPKLIYAAIALIMVFNQFASLSRNGFVGIIIALIVALLFLRKVIISHWKIMVPLFAISVIGVALLFVTDSVIAKRIITGFSGLNEDANYPLNSMETTEDSVLIDHDQFDITITYEPNNGDLLTPFNVYDAQNAPIDYTFSEEAGAYTTNAIAPNNFKFQYTVFKNYPLCLVNIDNNEWYFVVTDEGFQYMNKIQYIDTMTEVPSVGFEGKEGFASARGYIWSRSIPVIGKYPLFGSGPDTFALAFPQNDYVGKLNAYGTTNIIVDKPHNIYLDYAINTGIPSLIVLLIFWGIYIVWCFKLYFNSDFNSFYAKIGVASLTAIIGYLGSGFFNDTNQNVTPAFWIILGIGFAVNRLYVNETNKFST